jgi:translocation and assembly module TamB
MNRWLRWFAWSWLVLLPVALVFLVATEPGLRALILVSNRLSAGLLTIGSASGTLLGPLHFRDLRYADGIDTVLIETVDITWDPAQLFNRRIYIRSVHGSGVRVLLGESQGETLLSSFSLPAHLVIESVSAEKTAIFSEQKEIWLITTAHLANLSYQGPTLSFDHLVLTSQESTIQASGQLQTENDYPLRCSVAADIHPTGYQPIAARGTLTGPLNDLKLDAEVDSPIVAHLNGRIDKLLGQTTWEAGMESPAIPLPAIHQDWPDYEFTQVKVDGHGSFDTYTLAIHSAVQLPGTKHSTVLAAEIEGDGDGLRVPTLHLANGKMSLKAQGLLTWEPTLSWQASIDGTHLDPSLVATDWPGDLACTLTTRGEVRADQIHASFLLPKLHGTLRRFPLTGQGEASLDDNDLHITQLLLTSGGSSLHLQGNAAEALDFNLQLQSNNLAELWPNAHGQVDLRGRISGQRAKPEIDLHLNGSRVGLGQDGIEHISAETKGTLSPGGRITGIVQADQARFGATRLEHGRIQLQGSLQDHHIVIEGHNRDIAAALTFQGSLVDHQWQGSLRQTSLKNSRLGTWQQRQPAPLILSLEQIELKSLCLDAAPAALCVEGAWQAASAAWRLKAGLKAFPLDVLNTADIMPWPVEGQCDASLDLNGVRERILHGKFFADTSGMAIRPPLDGGSLQRLQWQKNDLRAEYANNQLRLILDSALADNSTLHAEYTQTNPTLSTTDLRRNPVQAKIQFSLRDLSFLSLLTNQAVLPSGALLGQWTITGPPLAPLINGRMEITNGQAEIPPLGITLAPLQITMHGDAASMQIQATAHSGSGTLQATSSINLKQPEVNAATVHLTGEAFKAAHLPEIDLDVSPDLHLNLNTRQAEIRGELTIPYARIKSIDFDQAAAASSDIVVLDEDAPTTAMNNLPLFASVQVIAGDDVHIDAFGLRGAVTGKLQVVSQPGRPQTGNGTLSVKNGSFTVYGRRLKIDLGRLLFSGGPLTNPGVELRSENKTERATTGVVVAGFLQHPEISFYSSPAMEQAAIVANLLETTAIGGETREDIGFVGKAAGKVGLEGLVPYLQGVKKISMIDEIKVETGDAYDGFSLVFGSWVTPDFYVSYGKDLVKESGSFNTRYTLGNGFFFLTETGASQSGGDIKYEFEF